MNLYIYAIAQSEGSNAAFWNDEDWHGGEGSAEVEYGLRVDCTFTPEFRKKLGIDGLEHY